MSNENDNKSENKNNDQEKNKALILQTVIIVFVFVVALGFIYKALNKKDGTDDDIIVQETMPEEQDTKIVIDDAFYNDIEIMNDACRKYYEDNKEKKDFFSIYNLLAYKEGSNYIDIGIDTLYSEGYIENQTYLDKYKDIMFTFLNASSFGIRKPEQVVPDIYIICETQDGFYVYNSEDKGFIMTEGKFKEFSEKIIHGDIVNPKSDSEDYKGIIAAVNEERQQEDEYVVRHIACNDLYAAVVLSTKAAVADVKLYGLKKIDGKWQVRLSGLEKDSDFVKTVNYKYTDFELGLLPLYNLSDYEGKIKDSFDEIVNMVKEQGAITDEDMPVVYSCGTDKMLYLQFKSGKKMIGGVTGNGSFDCDFFESYEEIIKYMVGFSKEPPVFIVPYQCEY